MKTFLQEIADTLRDQQASWENLTVIFPNRRATLYFRKELAKGLSSPQWSPTVLTIEEFIEQFSPLRETDKLSLVIRLFKVFQKVTGSQETIDQFYYWGEMLLRDFDELDKNLVNAEMLFRDLRNQKELDSYFDYLTEEQKKYLLDFWHTLDPATSENKKAFLEVWERLYPVYTEFRRQLQQDRLAYSGMMHREVAESIDSIFKPNSTLSKEDTIIFAGFNALTNAEERIISWLVKNRKAKVFWDEDEFYVSTAHREAGTFFRQYRNHAVLGATFPAELSSNLKNKKKVNLVGVSQKAGQPKLLSQQLEEAIQSSGNDNEWASNTVIVLPDENLLTSVLYSLPESLKAINVSMGYSLVNTPYYSLIDFLFDLHRHKRKEEFYFKNVLAILNHPYIKPYQKSDVQLIQKLIVDKNLVHISPSLFVGQVELLRKIFKPINSEAFITYLLEIIELLAKSSEDKILETEFAFHFHQMLLRIQEVAPEITDMPMLQRLFRQMARSEKVPFKGEPLKGIQIMGVLETRNLDFENVFILSLNEGLWPASARQGSYIPYNIRKAYGLPTAQYQDAMYAYLFYRLLQRANRVDLYYNTEPDVTGTGEMSRYLYQIMYETGWKYDHKILYNKIELHSALPITIEKDADVLKKLNRYLSKELTPSTLNSYIECRLKFYFRHLIGLKEMDEVEEAADARMFGNIFHDVLQTFYTEQKEVTGKWQIHKGHFSNLDQKLEKLIELAFSKQFNHKESEKMEYEGHQLIVKEMVKRMAERVLQLDESYAPFEIVMLEESNFKTEITVSQYDKDIVVSIGGKIDRVDLKDNTIRIIDYKTGRDENSFDSIASLFERTEKRNKAAFQAMLYGWIYWKEKALPYQQLQPGLINRKEIFKSDYKYGLQMGKEQLPDVSLLLPEFENHLRQLLTELFDPAQPFDQTKVLKNCEYCSYKEICRR
jgi:CRISPR/Cas system-associated exonuclease Cas4 (RecB family)